jgi:hypothetical protein
VWPLWPWNITPNVATYAVVVLTADAAAAEDFVAECLLQLREAQGIDGDHADLVACRLG